MVKVDQVSKLFRATSRAGGFTPALRKVSFELKPGEVISLIGESGSGKTTIGKVVLRLVQPTSGTVTFVADNSTVLGSAPVNPATGQASITVSSLGIGTHSIVAQFTANAPFQNSTSSALTQSVSTAGTKSESTRTLKK